MKKDDFRLCYVDGNIMYFTDNFEKQWGDDWDDAPYECNAEPPYERRPGMEELSGAGNIVIASYYDKACDIKLPCSDYGNSPYSVQDINLGAVPWVFKRGCGGLYGGATLAEAMAFCRKHDILFGVLENPPAESEPRKASPKKK